MGFGNYDGSIKIDTKLDTGNLEKGLKSLGQTVKTGFIAVGAGVAAGLGAATKAGMDFEAQMSKVGAISQASAEDMGLLTEKSKQMGIDTKFSATEAGEALEYMAMAGWKTEDMLNGIDGIMNLAAASGEDLGLVSDIVTDALTAFGLQAKDSAHFADVLATASSNANTNVSMMGGTFQYVAPVAGAMKFSIEDTAVAIGLMANAGIKAEKAGTALRSIFTRLAKPPKEAAEAIKALGLQTQNADGSFKSLSSIMTDLRSKFSKLTDAQKTQYAAMLGGQEAMSGLLSIVNASEDDFQKLTKAVNQADGSAKKMADTMNDNLKGQIVLLGSSLEGLGLAIYDGINSPMKEAVKSSIESVNSITSSFQRGELRESIVGIGNLFGGLVSLLSNIITTVLPPLISGIAWLGNNINTVIPIAAGLFAALKTWGTIVPIIQGVTTAWNSARAAVAAYNVAQIAFSSAGMISNATLTTGQALVGLLTGKVTLATFAQTAWNAVMSANPIGLVITAVAALTVGIGALILVQNNQKSETEQLIEKIKDQAEAYEELRAQQEETAISELSEIANVQRLKNELSDLVDENGKVTDANKGRVSFILGELNAACGTELQLIDNTVKGYKEISSSIDDVINKKRAKILLDAEEENYKQAILNIADAVGAQEEAYKALTEKREELSRLEEEFRTTGSRGTQQALWKVEDELKKLQSEYDETCGIVYNYSYYIQRYEDAAADYASGSTNKVIDALDKRGKAYYTASEVASKTAEEQKQILGQQFADAVVEAEIAAQNLERNNNEYNRKALENAQNHAQNMKSEYEKVGGAIVDGTVIGIGGKEINLKSKISSLFNMIPQWAKDLLGIHSPSKVFEKEVGEMIPLGEAKGIEKKASVVYKALSVLNDGMLESENKYLSEKSRIEAEQEKQEEEQREKEYQKRLKNAKASAEIEEIKQEEILRKQKIADERYLEDLKSKFDEENKILEEQKKSIVSAYTEIAKSAKSKLSEIEQAQSKLADKLKDYGSLYTEWTTTIKGGGENGQDLVFTEYRLNDLSKDIEALEAYKNALLAVKERGTPEGFFEVLQDLGIEEGTQFANTLLGLSDDKFKKYLDDWNRKNEIADSISKEFYKDKTDETLKEIEYELAAWYGTIPEGFLTEGKLSAEKFGEGFMEQLDSVFKEMEEAVSMNVSRISPTLTFGGGGAAGGNTTYSTTNQTFTIGTSKNTTSEQISQWQNATEVARLRGQA